MAVISWVHGHSGLSGDAKFTYVDDPISGGGFTRLLQQGNQPSIPVGRREGLNHPCFQCGPLPFEVFQGQNHQGLAALLDAPFDFGEGGNPGLEIPDVDGAREPGLFQPGQQDLGDPFSIGPGVGDENIVCELRGFGRGSFKEAFGIHAELAPGSRDKYELKPYREAERLETFRRSGGSFPPYRAFAMEIESQGRFEGLYQ